MKKLTNEATEPAPLSQLRGEALVNSACSIRAQLTDAFCTCPAGTAGLQLPVGELERSVELGTPCQFEVLESWRAQSQLSLLC